MNCSSSFIRTFLVGWALVGLAAFVPCSWAAELEAKPADPFFAKFEPVKAPPPGDLLLKAGDRLAICGDSITEQKMYSRIMETYLTVCVPQLNVTVRQYGWSGETAEGFLNRMKNDCLRFQPSVATTCYGMNDYKYRPYDEANGKWYREKYTAIVRAFKEAGVRVVLGSPGCIGKVASWVKSASGTVEEHNLHLCKLRNIDIEIAAEEKVRFADVFWPLFTAGFNARQKYNPDYAVAGKDGVHPGWAGQLIMAYAYLKALGLNGDMGTFTVDLAGGTATASEGHQVDGFKDGVLSVTSSRYPFCAGGPPDRDDSLRSGMTLVPFNEELNRLRIVVTGGTAANYKVTWGDAVRVYPAVELAKGVNLANDFVANPFVEAFARVDAAVLAKQAYETKQVKGAFHSRETKTDMDAIVKKTEAERAPLADAIKTAFVPVKHTLKVEAAPGAVEPTRVGEIEAKLNEERKKVEEAEAKLARTLKGASNQLAEERKKAAELQREQKRLLKERDELAKEMKNAITSLEAKASAEDKAKTGSPAQPLDARKTSYDVVLVKIADATRKIGVIQVVREITGLGLKEAKDLVDQAPRPVKSNVSAVEAETLKARLESEGAVIELK